MRCIGYAKSAPDEGSASAETDPSPAFDASHPKPMQSIGVLSK
jgi:hypothetical protein